MPLSALMTWNCQAWEHDKHFACRSSHRFLSTKWLLSDAIVLKKKLTCLEGVSPASPIGRIWVSVCHAKGTAINILLLNKVFNYNAPLLANLYEVVTANDIDACYVAIIMYTPATTDAVVGKFWLTKSKELDGGFKHYTCPSDPEVDKMKVQPATIRNDNGTTTTV